MRSIETKQSLCLVCIALPIFEIAKVFGLDIMECDCKKGRNRKYMTKFYTYYQNMIELFLWINIIFSAQAITDNVYCIGWTEMFSKNQIFIKSIFLFLGMFIAFQFSFFKRKRFCFLRNNSGYEGEEEIALAIISGWLAILHLILAAILVIIAITSINIFLYPVLKKTSKSEFEIVFCHVNFNLICVYSIGQLIGLSFMLIIVAILISKRFIHLRQMFNNLRKEEINLKEKVEELIEKHSELWSYIQEINRNTEIYLPILYGFSIYFICFLVCAILFFELEGFLLIEFLLISIITIVCTTVINFGLSRFAGLVRFYLLSYYLFI